MNIWVFAQEANGAPTSGTLELLCKAHSLASGSGGKVTAFVGGSADSLSLIHISEPTRPY